jgi:hypothetical protein
MKYSEIKEMYLQLENKVYPIYGTISKADIREFINWLKGDNELKELGFFEGKVKEFPFDICEIVEEYIEQSYF